MAMTKFDLDIARVDALEHDLRARPVAAAVDGVKRTLSQRSMVSAGQINRQRIYYALADHFNGALLELINILYAQDNHGWINVDDITGRVLVGLPWGSKAYRAWGMRSTEADALRALMLGRMAKKKHTPLLAYDAALRKWYLNFLDYQRKATAISYHNAHLITSADVHGVWPGLIAKRNGTKKSE